MMINESPIDAPSIYMLCGACECVCMRAWATNGGRPEHICHFHFHCLASVRIMRWASRCLEPPRCACLLNNLSAMHANAAAHGKLGAARERFAVGHPCAMKKVRFEMNHLFTSCCCREMRTNAVEAHHIHIRVCTLSFLCRMVCAGAGFWWPWPSIHTAFSFMKNASSAAIFTYIACSGDANAELNIL